MSARAYPLPRPDDDPRFTFGLQLDVAEVLQKHGYPKLSGTDLVDLGQALMRFLYASEERPAPAAEPDNSPLTFDEYRSALSYWEQKAAEAQASGDRAAIAYRAKGVEALRLRVQRAEAIAQRGEWHVDISDEALAVLASNAGTGVTR